MTQLERIVQAKESLEQLAQGQDPITGEPLPDTSAARAGSVIGTLRGCALVLEEMIAEDAPVPDPSRTNNFRRISAVVAADAQMMGRLARGCHLYTAVPLDPKDPLGRQELRERFAFLQRALNNSLLAGYFTAKGPFSLPQGAVLPISREPVELEALLERINALRDADAVRPLTPNTLEPYLASQGVLAEAPRTGGRKEYFPAPDGRAQGITQARHAGPDGRVGTTLVFSSQAQQYVADHLDDIAAYLADTSRWEPFREGQPPRQIDALKRARDWLEQLSRGTDPLTGKDLPGVCAAGEERVRELLASCARDLYYMALRDEPQCYPDGSTRLILFFPLRNSAIDPTIKSRDAIAQSILGIERLARGCHPDTGASLDPRDPLTQEQLGKCFAFVGRCLRNTYIANNYTAMVPFTLSKEARSKIRVSQEPVTITTLASRINTQREDSTAVLGISTEMILHELESRGLVRKYGGEGVKKALRITPQGKALGIRVERFEPVGRAPYTAPAFDANAQKYVIDHLGSIIMDRMEYAQRSRERLAETLQSLESSSRRPPARAVPTQQPPARKPVPPKSEEETPMRHLDVLKHAYTYLDQLLRSVDPVTQAPLPDSSAGRDDSVQKLISFCRGDLRKMIGYDDPELNRSGQSVCRLDRQGRVSIKAIVEKLERLGRGCHPDTGASLDPQDPLGQERLRRCFAFAAQCLRNALSAGYFTAKAPFSLSPEARSRISISQAPVSMIELTQAINAQRGDSTAMRGVQTKAIFDHLHSQDLLTRLPGGESVPTPEGTALGLEPMEVTKADGTTFLSVTFSPDAQRYIVDHLDDITAAKWTKVGPAVTGQPIPQDGDDRAQTLSDAFRRAGELGERQVDALAQAKGYLEQLHAYTDPLTGEYLSGDQTARNAAVNRLFSSCAQALEMIIAYDSGAKAQPSQIVDLAFRQQNVQGMERLARGCHPDTGASLDPQDPLNQEGLRGCFAFVAQCLRRAVDAGAYTAKAPFALSQEARRSIPISQEPIGMVLLLKAINAQREDETAVRPLISQTLRGYLAAQGLLTETPGKNGSKKYVLSPKSEGAGIGQKEGVGENGGAYTQIVYGPAAQQFVVDHLDDIAAFQANK